MRMQGDAYQMAWTKRKAAAVLEYEAQAARAPVDPCQPLPAVRPAEAVRQQSFAPPAFLKYDPLSVSSAWHFDQVVVLPIIAWRASLPTLPSKIFFGAVRRAAMEAFAGRGLTIRSELMCWSACPSFVGIERSLQFAIRFQAKPSWTRHVDAVWPHRMWYDRAPTLTEFCNGVDGGGPLTAPPFIAEIVMVKSEAVLSVRIF
eukprot:Skav221661  [mRNA]  locus=scaffold1750:190003:191656:+ [translate_table: standard]